MKVTRLFLLFFFLFSGNSILAQNFHFADTIRIPADEKADINLADFASSLKVSHPNIKTFEITLEARGDRYRLSDYLDFHSETPSAFIIFDEPIDELTIQVSDSVILNLDYFYAPPKQIGNNRVKHKKSDCEKPNTISYKTWRAGLPEPNPGRQATIVKHCIIHHTAGSNSNTNYTDIVRNIYLAHTEGNGWDDIGYNYLIAQDGTIYSGRDPQNVADEDNIQGAHFCSKNNGTMGIAVLGNYNLTTPTLETLNSLSSLLTWKLNKENVNPFGESPHPNSLGEMLGHIAVHQDGCATRCPGDNLLLEIDRMKAKVNKNLEGCGVFLSSFETNHLDDVVIFPNPAREQFNITNQSGKLLEYSIFSVFGIELQSGILNTYSKSISLKPGAYTIMLKDKDNNSVVKKLNCY